MKKLAIMLFATLLLASCMNKTDVKAECEKTGGTYNESTKSCDNKKEENKESSTDSNIPNDAITLTADEKIEGLAAENGSEVELLYILRVDGKVFDTNVASGGILDTKKSPLKAMVGAGGLIPGFEKQLIGMRKGDVKKFTVSPAEGYGEAMIKIDLPKSDLAPEFERQMPVESLEGIFTREIAIKEFLPEIQEKIKTAKKDDILLEDETIKLKFISKTDSKATVHISTPLAPFYKQKLKGESLKVGMESTIEEGTFKVTKIDWNTATVSVSTDKNPFTKETFKVGESGKYEIAPQQTVDMKIIEIKDDSVTAEIPNTHELANKELNFEVKVINVMPSILVPSAETPKPESK